MQIEHLGCTRSIVCTSIPNAALVTVRETQIEVAINDALRFDVVRLIERWQEREAKRYLTERVRALSDQTGLPVRRLSFRRQRSRWGSCNHCGDLSLNLSLITIDPELIDYVIVHELSHTKHMNHSRAFWREVERHCPSAKLLDRALRKKGLTH